MFCPVCKYEFRRGFTHCNQCDVDLIDTLPAEPEVGQTAPASASALDHPALLWSGASSGIFSALTAALENAAVPYNKEELDARLVFTSQHGDLEVWVPAAHLQQAEAILQSVLANPLNSEAAQNHYSMNDNEPAGASDDSELPDESDDGAGDIRNENVTRELYPEEATAEIWSGADERMAEILKSCLAEIGIACYIHRPGADFEADAGSLSSESHSNDTPLEDTTDLLAMRVLPEDETPAREIVRQVTTAAPPQ